MLTTHPFDDDKLREECGIFGVWGADTASAVVALGLHLLAVELEFGSADAVRIAAGESTKVRMLAEVRLQRVKAEHEAVVVAWRWRTVPDEDEPNDAAGPRFFGGLLGGFLLGLAEAIVVWGGGSAYTNAVAFVILIVVLLFMPGGLLGSAKVEKV